MTERQRLLKSNINGEVNNIELIELLIAEREKNELYRVALYRVERLTDGKENLIARYALENERYVEESD